MTCHECKLTTFARAIGRWYSPIARIPWTRFMCMNPACRFKYEGHDGVVRSAQPTWMTPTKEVTQ